MTRMRLLPFLAILFVSWSYPGAAPASADAGGLIKAADMKEWLTFLASDELEGRNTYTEGLGIAAEFIAERLKSWGVKPGGDKGSYFQRVPVQSVKVTDNSTITVETNGQSRTFKVGEGFTLPRLVGGKRDFNCDQVEFVGYGLKAGGQDDYAGLNVKGKVVIWMGSSGPNGLDQSARRLLFGRSRAAVEEHGAAAVIGQGGGFGGGRRGGGGGGGGAGSGAQTEVPDLISAEKLDLPRAPQVGGRDELFDFLFSGQEAKYADLKAKAADRTSLPHFTLKGVKITFNLAPEYRVIRTQYTRNVVGIVEGKDRKLCDTYVAFGAHYDHVGYAEQEVTEGINGPRRPDAKGRVTPGTVEHRIWNGADDDGSGTVTLLSLARAFAKGPKPKRSLIFVWHAGEEKGLWGSHYFADCPTVPLEKIVAQINMDMVGRNRDNKTEEADKVYLVGSDRISSEFHSLNMKANTMLQPPLKLDFEMNDPADPENIYYRSDHYSYAAKGIPIVFLTTGLHPDYHANTDTPDKILYDKMARIGRFAYQVGFLTANLDHPPVRDFKGPRIGKGSDGKLP